MDGVDNRPNLGEEMIERRINLALDGEGSGDVGGQMDDANANVNGGAVEFRIGDQVLTPQQAAAKLTELNTAHTEVTGKLTNLQTQYEQISPILNTLQSRDPAKVDQLLIQLGVKQAETLKPDASADEKINFMLKQFDGMSRKMTLKEAFDDAISMTKAKATQARQTFDENAVLLAMQKYRLGPEHIEVAHQLTQLAPLTTKFNEAVAAGVKKEIANMQARGELRVMNGTGGRAPGNTGAKSLGEFVRERNIAWE